MGFKNSQQLVFQIGATVLKEREKTNRKQWQHLNFIPIVAKNNLIDFESVTMYSCRQNRTQALCQSLSKTDFMWEVIVPIVDNNRIQFNKPVTDVCPFPNFLELLQEGVDFICKNFYNSSGITIFLVGNFLILFHCFYFYPQKLKFWIFQDRNFSENIC